MTGTTQHVKLVFRVREIIEEYGMIRAGHAVVVGVSGGPDSVALLHVLHMLSSAHDFRVMVAHLDHQLRPESARDAAFVKELAESLGADFHHGVTNVQQLALAEGLSVEEAGRRARYDFFERVRNSVAADVIATAHHLDDSMETFFLRVFRGSTVKGLGGVPPVRGRIVRPLIGVLRSDILQFLKEQAIPYRIDSTNLSTDTDRNYIRNRLIPAILERFPHFRQPLARTMKLIAEEEKVLDRLASDLSSQWIERAGKRIRLDVRELRASPEVLASRAILQALYRISGPGVRWARVHLDTIMSIVHGENPSAQVDLPGGLRVFREYDRLWVVVGRQEPPEPYSMVVTNPGEVVAPSTGTILRFQIMEPGSDCVPGSADARIAYFDGDRAEFPLTVRSPVPGDRIKPWGLKGSRKLKNIFIDLKVPRRLRTTIPVLEKDREILWIPGIRRGRAAPVDSGTQRVLKVTALGDMEWVVP